MQESTVALVSATNNMTYLTFASYQGTDVHTDQTGDHLQ